MFTQFCNQYNTYNGNINGAFYGNSIPLQIPQNPTRSERGRIPGLFGENTGENPNIKVALQDKELWASFSRVGTEMIITKTGRRMFPGVKISLEGLQPNKKYCIVLDVQAVDEKRYKFSDGEWKVGGRAEPHHQRRFFVHPDSPNTGLHWEQNHVST